MSKRTIKKVILIILIILLAAAAAILILLRILAGRTNYTKDSDVSLQIETETEKPLHAADIYEIEKVKTVDEEQRKGTYALLVIGGDTPEAEAEGNREDASAVILMVVNHNLGYVYFASMRTDIYVRIPAAEGEEAGTEPDAEGEAAGIESSADTPADGSVSAQSTSAVPEGQSQPTEGKLGHVYAIGGGPLLAKTIEENYGIHMDNYASISMKDVARIINIPEFETLDVSKDGLMVVKELVYSLNAVSPMEVAGYVTKVLPYVTHNVTSDQMMRIIMQIPAIVGYYPVEENIPYEGAFTQLDGYIVPDIGYTSARMQELIYGKEEAQTQAETELQAS